MAVSALVWVALAPAGIAACRNIEMPPIIGSMRAMDWPCPPARALSMAGFNEPENILAAMAIGKTLEASRAADFQLKELAVLPVADPVNSGDPPFPGTRL